MDMGLKTLLDSTMHYIGAKKAEYAGVTGMQEFRVYLNDRSREIFDRLQTNTLDEHYLKVLNAKMRQLEASSRANAGLPSGSASGHEDHILAVLEGYGDARPGASSPAPAKTRFGKGSTRKWKRSSPVAFERYQAEHEMEPSEEYRGLFFFLMYAECIRLSEDKSIKEFVCGTDPDKLALYGYKAAAHGYGGFADLLDELGLEHGALGEARYNGVLLFDYLVNHKNGTHLEDYMEYGKAGVLDEVIAEKTNDDADTAE